MAGYVALQKRSNRGGLIPRRGIMLSQCAVISMTAAPDSVGGTVLIAGSGRG